MKPRMKSGGSRERIITAAKHLFHAGGYASVSVQGICEEADVKKGSFYHFFPSKQDLLFTVIAVQGESQQDLMRRAMRDDIPVVRRIERLAEMLYERHREIHRKTARVLGCPIGTLAAELSPTNELVRLRLQEMMREFPRIIEAALAEAVESGDLPAMDPLVTAQKIFAYQQGVLLLAMAENDPELVRRLGQGAVDLVTAGRTP